MAKSVSKSTETGNRTKLSALPRTVQEADALLAELGYVKTTVYSVELDRMAVVSADEAHTLFFTFHPDEEYVEITRIEGWPID